MLQSQITANKNNITTLVNLRTSPWSVVNTAAAINDTITLTISGGYNDGTEERVTKQYTTTIKGTNIFHLFTKVVTTAGSGTLSEEGTYASLGKHMESTSAYHRIYLSNSGSFPSTSTLSEVKMDIEKENISISTTVTVAGRFSKGTFGSVTYTGVVVPAMTYYGLY